MTAEEIDTSAENVERVARRLASVPFDMEVNDFDAAAALLRALAAERDAADEALKTQVQVNEELTRELMQANDCAQESADIMRRQRDRLEAELAAARAQVRAAAEAMREKCAEVARADAGEWQDEGIEAALSIAAAIDALPVE